MSFRAWRRLHLGASGVLGAMALLHSALTPALYNGWGPDAAWFLGTGLGLLLLAIVNWTHLGLEPCRLPTAAVLRWANAGFLGFGGAAAIAVPEPPAYVIVAGLAAQALASWRTLPGPD